MENKNVIGSALAVISLVGFLGVVSFLCFGEVKAANKDFFNMALMALIGFVGTSFGFYLGTSVSGAKKDETIATALQTKEETK
jgi:multisubunit Na+/H+ antiporter MnhF subunit